MAKQTVDKKLLLKVAANARLNLTEKEVNLFLKDFKEILKAFETLDEISVEGEKPSFQPIQLENVVRKDEVEKCLSQEDALKNTRNKKDGYFMGPKAL